MKKRNNDILIIPDGHARPDLDNDRFDWLGQYILKTKPGTVICIGDLPDFPSLSSYDEGTGNAWNRLYVKDCEAAIDAQERIWGPTDEYNRKRKHDKRSLYKPRKIYCAGNHEDRADRFVNAHPLTEGFIEWRRDIKVDDYWNEFVRFKDEIDVHGVSFSHYFSGGLTGQPISGVNIARSMVLKLSRSAVQGHSHIFSYNYGDRGPGKPLIECWSCGCFSHPDHIEGWNRNTVATWRYGVLHLHNVHDGCPTDGWTWREQDYLRRQYSE